MSNKTPIILKKDDSQRPKRQGHQPIQPKILIKPNNKDNNITIAYTSPLQCLQMKRSVRLMRQFQIDQKILQEYLDNDNTDFLVVGVCGLKNVGKSTLMNIIASQNLSDDKPEEVFQTNGLASDGVTLDMFITASRIIFLDTSPLTHNAQKRDMIVSECDDVKAMMVLLQLCHMVLVVNDGFPDSSVSRLLTVADQMIPIEVKQRPTWLHVSNKVQPGNKLLSLDPRVARGSSLLVPDLHHRSVHLHHDVPQVIQDLQEKVYMMKRWSMALETDDEPFTEKKWGQRLVAVSDNIKNEYFLRKYEMFRDKFHQPIET